MQILVRNLDRDLSEADLLELFEEFGKVESCALVMDKETGRSKGFGFIEMPHMDQATEAIKQLNGLKLGTSAMRVKRAAQSTIKKRGPKGQ